MADGTTRSIEQVTLGDKVLATDPDTGRTVSRKVVATWAHDSESKAGTQPPFPIVVGWVF